MEEGNLGQPGKLYLKYMSYADNVIWLLKKKKKKRRSL